MKNFKHHHSEGFGFLEVVGSLLIIGVLLTALFTMEGSVLGRFRKSVQKEERIYGIKNSLFSLAQSGSDITKKQDLKTDEGLIAIMYEPVKKESKLARFEGLMQQKRSITWKDDIKDRTVELITYVFIPPKKKEEKKA